VNGAFISSFENMEIQYIFLGVFSLVFIVGSLYLKNSINLIDSDKSNYPILVYSYHPDIVYNIVDFISHSSTVAHYNIVFPDSLENMLIAKYRLTDYKDIRGEFSLPYQVEIFIKPNPIKDLVIFAMSLSSAFPGCIVHYETRQWALVEAEAKKLYRYVLIICIVSLVLYIFIQMMLRYIHILRNRENINAILISGIKTKRLLLAEFLRNLIWFGISTGSIALLNIIVNYFEIMSSLTMMITPHDYYMNIDLVVLFAVSNLILLSVHRPLLRKVKND
jgi:hypothetical protein